MTKEQQTEKQTRRPQTLQVVRKYNCGTIDEERVLRALVGETILSESAKRSERGAA